MLRNSLILLAALALYGCATTEPVIKTVIQRVEIPIPVACKVIIPTEPEFGFDKLKIEDTLYFKTQTVLSDRELHIAYEAELLAALKSCIE